MTRDAIEVEQELAADGIHHGSRMAEGEARPGAHQAGFEQRIGHAGDGLHGHDGMADGRGRHVIFAEGAQGPQLSEVLEGVGLLHRNQFGFFPSLQLVGTDLENP